MFMFGLEHYREMKGRAFNVGLSAANLSKRELCERIQRHIPGSSSSSPALARTLTSATTSFRTTGSRPPAGAPRFSLDDGIRELIQAYGIVRQRAFTNL